MKVEKIFISTYRYDFHLAKICIASVRYWYPQIPIYLIKDEAKGKFDTEYTERLWNVKVLQTDKKKFGWGYGKLEVLFLDDNKSFLVIDSDTVLTGPVLNAVENIQAQFIVDREEQPDSRFNQIYYNLDRICEVDKDFRYPGYSFNTGQWFGTSSLIRRTDFTKTLYWSDPPLTIDPRIVVNNDQGHLNFVIHSLEQRDILTVTRVKLMVWPVDDNADFISLDSIKNRTDDYPFIIHWAGMSSLQFSSLPRQDILKFYKKIYYSRAGSIEMFLDGIKNICLEMERKISFQIKKRKKHIP